MANQEIIWVTPNKIHFPIGVEHLSPLKKNIIVALSKGVTEYGYMLDNSIIQKLETLILDSLIDVSFEILNTLKSAVGDAPYKTVSEFVNSDKMLFSVEEVTTYLAGLKKYWENITDATETFPLFEDIEVIPEKILYWISEDTTISVFKRTIESKVEYPPSVLKTIVKYKEFISKLVDIELIPNKENLASLVKVFGLSFVLQRIHTATDLLRVIVGLADGDTTLAKNTKNFKAIKFTREIRKTILAILNGLKYNLMIEDMLRYRAMWLKLGEILHPGDYAGTFQNCFAAFKALRNDKLLSFAGLVDRAGDIAAKVALLKTRPGIFARSLDSLLRNKSLEDTILILTAFGEIASKVENKVLMQIYAHFKNREELRSGNEIYFKKDSGIPKEFKAGTGYISESLSSGLTRVIESTLRKKYSDGEDLFSGAKKIWVDPSLIRYPIPVGSRSASGSGRVIAKGTRFPVMLDTKSSATVLRLFIYWKNIRYPDGTENRTDIDLSILVLYANGNKSRVSFSRLYDDQNEILHSGDFTNAPWPDGASEFIDIPLKELKDVKYIMVSLHNYTNTVFNQLEVCYFGWMLRQYPKSGELFEPKTVQHKVDILSNKRSGQPLIYDVKGETLVWLDANAEGSSIIENEPIGNLAALEKLLDKYERMPNLFDLYRIQAGNRLTKLEPEADFKIGIEESHDLHPWDPLVM